MVSLACPPASGLAASSPSVAVYLRVSSEEQREKQTIETQRYEAERYAAYQRIDVTDWYADDGVSGTIPVEHRPQGSRLLRDAAEGKFGAVVVYKIDRLGRKVIEILRAVETLRACNVRLISICEQIDTETPAGQAFLNMLSTFAQFERDTIRERTMGGAARAAREGRFNGGKAPYGYRVVGEKNDRRLEVDEDEAAIVRDLFGQYLGGKSTIDVALYLNAAYGLAKKHHWVAQVLRSTTYVGEHAWRKERWTTGADGRSKVLRKLPPDQHVIIRVPPLVDRETFDAAQERLRTNLSTAYKRAKRDYLLRSLVRCGNCAIDGVHARMAGTGKERGQRFYYMCLGHRNGPYTKPCGNMVRAEVVEEPVWAKLEAWLRNPGEVVEEVAERLRAEEPDLAGTEAKRRRLLELLAEKEAEHGRVTEMTARGMIGFAAAEKQFDRINAETATLRAQLDEVSEELDRAGRAQARLYTAERVLAELREIADRGEGNWRRQVVTGLIDRIIVSSERRGPNSARSVHATVYDRL